LVAPQIADEMGALELVAGAFQDDLEKNPEELEEFLDWNVGDLDYAFPTPR